MKPNSSTSSSESSAGSTPSSTPKRVSAYSNAVEMGYNWPERNGSWKPYEFTLNDTNTFKIKDIDYAVMRISSSKLGIPSSNVEADIYIEYPSGTRYPLSLGGYALDTVRFLYWPKLSRQPTLETGNYKIVIDTLDLPQQSGLYCEFPFKLVP